MQKELDDIPVNLAKGGFAKFSQKYDPNVKQPSKPSKPSESTTTMPGSPTMAKNAFTEPQDQGTDVVLAAMHKEAPPFGAMGTGETQHYPPCINPSCKSYGRSHPNCLCYGGVGPKHGVGEAGNFAEGGEVEEKYFCNDNRAHFKDCEYYSQGGHVKGVHKSSMDERTGEWAGESKAGEHVRSSDLRKHHLVKAKEEHYKVLGEMKSMPKPKIQGFDDGGQVQPQFNASAAPVEVPEYQNTPPTVADVPATMATPTEEQQHQQMLMNERQNIQNDLNNGHIKPETYKSLFAKKDTLGKIGTIFGMLVGSMGSGMSGQPNALMKMMDDTINRDLEAQKTSATNRQNFLNIAQHGLANQANVTGQNIANDTNKFALAKMSADLTALDSIVKETQKYPEGTPQRQKADMALAVLAPTLDKAHASMAAQVAIAQAQANLAGRGGGNTTFLKSGMAGTGLANMAQDTEQKTIDNTPAVAGQMASRPIAGGDREQVNAMNTLEDKAKQLIDFSKAHEGTWDPSTRAKAQQMANELVGFYSNSLGTSMTEGNRTWLDEQIAKKNPTSAISQILYGSNAKLKEIMESNNMRRKTKLKSMGFHPKEEGHKDEGKIFVNPKTKERGTIQNGKWKKL